MIEYLFSNYFLENLYKNKLTGIKLIPLPRNVEKLPLQCIWDFLLGEKQPKKHIVEVT